MFWSHLKRRKYQTGAKKQNHPENFKQNSHTND